MVCGLLALLLSAGLAQAQSNVALLWTRLHADLLKTAAIPPPMITRNMWLLDSTIYSAWTVYDSTAVATLSVPDKISTASTATVATAINYAAFTLLSDVYNAFPNELQLIQARATSLQVSLSPPSSADHASPEYVGYSVGLSGIAYARTDGCNDRGQNQNSATSTPFSGRPT